MYTEKDIENILQEHLVNVSKLRECEIKIKNLKDLKKLNRKKLIISDTEAIEAMQLNSALANGISSKTNKISNVTEKTALTYKSQMVHTNKLDFVKIENDINHYANIKNVLELKIKRIETILASLNNIEKFVIEQFYMYCDKRWDYVKDAFVDKYRDIKSTEQLRRYKKTAMDKMLEVINL